MATLHFLKEAAHIPLGYVFIPKQVSRFFFIGQGMLSECSNFKFHLVSKQLNIIQRSCEEGTRHGKSHRWALPATRQELQLKNGWRLSAPGKCLP